ncbi:MAG: SpoIID/LytB domain-containing protein, partial [Candidatus Peregrinibacteria bacterium]|nr:SpoIID/LytB domain-containing protein [Candidatus Peregrinibacteria bacterium]
PGETGTFIVTIKPTTLGSYEENFQLVMEHYGWIPGASVKWNIKVSGTEAATSTSATSVLSASILDSSEPTTTTTTPTTTTTTTASTTSSTSGTERPFRVRLTHSGDSATLTADSQFLILNENNEALFNFFAGKQISVTRSGSSFQVKAGDITKTANIVRLMPKEAGGISEIVSMERRPSWNQNLNDNRFRGIIEMRVVDSQTAYINELPLEDYLKGLAEVSNTAPTEKQKVIAVLARTYAKFYMSDTSRKFPGMPYDGSDDPAIFQRYLGYGVETRSPNFVSAVGATTDVVVTYNGQLVKTPYFNQSDGRTRSAQEVWGWTHTPYLVSVPDPWSSGLSLNGHGVGLSGLGATKQAEAGKSYEEIIKYYYIGIEVQKAT